MFGALGQELALNAVKTNYFTMFNWIATASIAVAVNIVVAKTNTTANTAMLKH